MNKKPKTLLITGATRGIGEAIALRFADAGFHVVPLHQSLFVPLKQGRLPIAPEMFK